MYVLQGTLINVFTTPKGKTKDGEQYGGDDKLQILQENTLKNGDKRMDLVELSVADGSIYSDKLNQKISIPVSISFWQGKSIIKSIS